MTHRGRTILVAALLALLPVPALAQTTEARKEEKGTFLGALFAPANGTSPAAPGAVVTFVLPGSPAALAGLRRNDHVVRYDGTKVRDSAHLARLIHDDRPGRKVKLAVLRDRGERALEATLVLGPALKLANTTPLVVAKPPTPPPGGVCVYAIPLDGGKVKLTVEYVADGRPQRLTCQGAARDIDSAVRKLPERERGLVLVALRRLRDLNLPDTRTK
jgi:membrane-associated protease RseP (regulator of RpoE activity)